MLANKAVVPDYAMAKLEAIADTHAQAVTRAYEHGGAALAHSSGPSANRIRPSRPAKSRIQSSGKECRSAWPPVVLRIAPVTLPHPRHHRRHTGHRRPGSGRSRAGRAGVADPGSVQHYHPVANGPAVPRYEQLSLDSVHHSPRWTD